MKKETRKKAYYLTQYANYETDQGVYEALDYWIKNNEINEDDFIILLDLMPDVADNINSIVYNRIYSLDNNQLLTLVELYDKIIAEDIDEMDRLTNYKLSDYMTDHEIYTPDLWADCADEDLKCNGIDANCLYWVKEIDYSADYLEINGYANGFYSLNKSDVIDQFLTDCLDDLLNYIL